jgi:hypothetical protein
MDDNKIFERWSVMQKSQLAQLIAKFLSKKFTQDACSIHEFSGKFPPTGETVLQVYIGLWTCHEFGFSWQI